MNGAPSSPTFWELSMPERLEPWNDYFNDDDF
jgi:hypothetical protein